LRPAPRRELALQRPAGAEPAQHRLAATAAQHWPNSKPATCASLAAPGGPRRSKACRRPSAPAAPHAPHAPRSTLGSCWRSRATPCAPATRLQRRDPPPPCPTHPAPHATSHPAHLQHRVLAVHRVGRRQQLAGRLLAQHEHRLAGADAQLQQVRGVGLAVCERQDLEACGVGLGDGRDMGLEVNIQALLVDLQLRPRRHQALAGLKSHRVSGLRPPRGGGGVALRQPSAARPLPRQRRAGLIVLG
jgi:hypothetical protein